MGEEADRGLTRVDVLFTPEKNTWRDRTTAAQLQVKALQPAAGASPLPPEERFFETLLQEMTHLAENVTRLSACPRPQTQATVKRLLRGGTGGAPPGTRAGDRTGAFVGEFPGETDVRTGRVEDPRPFNALLCAPEMQSLGDQWRHVVRLDGCAVPGELEWLGRLCPARPSFMCCACPRPWRTLMVLPWHWRMNPCGSCVPDAAPGAAEALLWELARGSGLTVEQTLVGLTGLLRTGLRLVEFRFSPFTLRMLPPAKMLP